MRVLVACEFSGTVRDAFRARGHDAWSCDLLPDVISQDYHIQGDAIEIIKQGGWDLVISHPPCTHLAISGARWFAQKRADGRQQAGIDLFMAFINTCTEMKCKWAVENPKSIMSTKYRKPDQIIQPWQFGRGETKGICLWLSGLPKLRSTDIVDGRYARSHSVAHIKDRWKIRSKTYAGLAKAMAEQWAPDESGKRNEN